jgi:hypothetical protein
MQKRSVSFDEEHPSYRGHLMGVELYTYAIQVNEVAAIEAKLRARMEELASNFRSGGEMGGEEAFATIHRGLIGRERQIATALFEDMLGGIH